MPGKSATDRDLDLYFVGLNHHSPPDCPSGTRESDLQHLADYIVQQSPVPAKLIIAATGTNYRKDGGLYVDLNACPANRLQHVLEEKYQASLTGIGPLCWSGSEYRVILGSGWDYAESETVPFHVGGDPDGYLFTRLHHIRTGATLRLFDVRFATDEKDKKAEDLRRRQLNILLPRALEQAGGQAIVIGDYNFTWNYPEADALLSSPDVQWITRNLACETSTLFTVPDIENISVVNPSHYTQTNSVLELVGVAHSANERIQIPEICHEVLALRFKLLDCAGGAFCHGVCTLLNTETNCGRCGHRCAPHEKCQDSGACATDRPSGGYCPAGTRDCGVDCNGTQVCWPSNKPGGCPSFPCRQN